MYIGKLVAAGPHDEFVDRIVHDLLDEDVNAVVGLRAVAQLADIHAGAQTDMLPRRIEDKVVSVRDYGRGIPLKSLAAAVSEMNTGGASSP